MEFIEKWCPAIMQLLLLGVPLFAMQEALLYQRRVMRAELPEPAPAVNRRLWPTAVLLALLSGGLVVVGLVLKGWSILAGAALPFVIGAMALPFMWGGGNRATQQAPVPVPLLAHWPRRPRLKVCGVIWSIGLFVLPAMLLFVRMHVGESIRGLEEWKGEKAAAWIAALWLMVNAPWLEETVLRHYLLPKLWRRLGGGRVALWVAIIIMAAVFALGHGGHLEPPWPKLLQTFTWGLALGWVRFAFGTPWAIGLHLAWNLSALLVAPFMPL